MLCMAELVRKYAYGYLRFESQADRTDRNGALYFISLYLGKVIHSKIYPRNMKKRYQVKSSKAEGFRGTITAGEMVFVPAGFWHYVKSSDLNIGINFLFISKIAVFTAPSPLRSFWIKDNITLWPVRMIWKWNVWLFRTIRYFIPKNSS